MAEMSSDSIVRVPPELSELPFRRTVHYTALHALPTDHPRRQEWDTYRRELPRLLREGREGQFVLIRGDCLVALCDSYDQARATGEERFGPGAYLVQPILERIPVLRVMGSIQVYAWPI